LLKLDGVADAFCGTTTVVHMKGDAKLDTAAVAKVLKAQKVKTKGELSKDATKLL